MYRGNKKVISPSSTFAVWHLDSGMAHILVFYFCEKYRGLKRYLLAHSLKGLKSGNNMAGFSAPLGISQGQNQGVYQAGLLSGGSGKE